MKCLKCSNNDVDNVLQYYGTTYCNTCLYGQVSDPADQDTDDEFDEADETEVQVDEEFDKRINASKTVLHPKGHVVDCYYCGKPWAKAKVDVHSGDLIRGSDFESLQGQRLGNGTLVRCNECGTGLQPEKLTSRPVRYDIKILKPFTNNTKATASGRWKAGRKHIKEEVDRAMGAEEPPKTAKPCDCGAEKAQTTHATWCSAYEPEKSKEKTPWHFQGGCL